VPKQTKLVPKRTKVAKKTYIVIPILRTTSGGGAEKDNCSAETEKIGAENAKIESAEKSTETVFEFACRKSEINCPSRAVTPI
jgi:hypothetical protein